MASKTRKRTTSKPPATRSPAARKIERPRPPVATVEKKRSLTVPLIFIGTLGAFYYLFSSNDEDVQVQQYTYQNLQDCQADWGSDDANCQPEQSSSGSSSGGTSSGHGGAYTTSSYNSFYGDNTNSGQRYNGPRFFWQRTGSGGYPVEIRPDGSTRQISGAKLSVGQASSHAFSSHVSSGSISRGGFGSSAGHFSAGG